LQIAGARFPVWLLAIYVVSLLAIATWPFTAFSSVFMFDAPGSTSNPSANVAAGTLVCWPIIPIAGTLTSFFIYKKGRKRPAYVLAGLALLPILILALGMAVLTITSWIGFLSGPKF
jgi:hypothetical protein